MKKLIALGLLLVCIITLCSCQKDSNFPVISEDVTKIEVSCFVVGETGSWSIDGMDISRLKEWLNNLSWRPTDFMVPYRTAPDCKDGQKVYTFYLTGGECSYFSFYPDRLMQKGYIESRGNWFSVSGPRFPYASNIHTPTPLPTQGE